jgi:hypothetical protein
MNKTALSLFFAGASIFAASRIRPEAEYSFIRTAGGSVTETVISWNISGVASYDSDHNISSVRRHFSIENYQDGDIDDAFIISIDKNAYKPDASGGYSWTAVNIEGYKNVDDAWINITIGF